MSKYKAVYKCLICGTEQVAGYMELPSREEAARQIEKVVGNQQFINNPYLYKAPLYQTHDCRDGSCGLAHFAGLRRC